VQVSDGVWTTQEMLDLEQRALSWRQERDALPAFQPATQRQLWNGLRIQQEHDGVSLEGEQLDAYRALLSQRTPAITGQAGTGKGAVLSAAGHVWRTQGRRIFAVALAGATAQRLAAQLGDGAKALTIDALSLRLERDPGGVRDEDVIVVDEAGMIDTRRWAKLAAALGPKATVVAVGDHAQLSPISAGGLWPVLAEGSVQLQRVYRTPVAWQRDAWRHPRDGRSIEALSAYASHGLLAVVDTRDEALAAAVDAWNREGRTGQIITDATNAERHRANQAAQARRREAGELGEASLTVTCDEGPVTLHSGDRVIFRAQVHVPDARRVENGTTGEIVAVHADSGEVEVRTNEPVSRTVRVSAGDAQLDLAYAGHIHVLQGATTDTAYIVCGGWQTDRQRLYTCVSRSRNAAQVFVDRESLGRDAEAAALDELARRAQRDGGKVAASSHLRETRRRPRAPATRPKRPMSLVHRYARRQGRLETLWQQRFAEYQTIRRRVLRRWSADYQVAMSQQQIEHPRTSGPR
jgi:ATP-dependent exoDNAse (exonuclease V) alpha subunit